MKQPHAKNSEDHRARAIAKLKMELSKDVGRAAEIAGHCGLWDILRLCFLLRLNRVSMAVPMYRKKMSHADLMAAQLYDEALKYAIALAAKHGNWDSDALAIESMKGFDNERVIQLSKLTSYINSKFETEKLLYVAEVRVSGARDQDCTLDIQAGIDNPERSMYLDFGVRVEQSTMRSKDKLLSVEELVRRLYMEYADVADLFESENGISLAAYCEGMATLGFAIQARGAEAEYACVDAKGMIYPDQLKTFIAIARSMIFTDAELEPLLTPEFLTYLRQHFFDANAQNDAELRFHYMSRRPFLMGQGFAILSPDLVFDSVLDNAHFTLLESEESKQTYMNRKSMQFIDQIVSAASTVGFEEIDRDVYLMEGKDTIGDIDLIMRNKETGNTLLIEAKNHALPLDVYFVSPDSIKRHVDRTLDWERKVRRRIAHLQGNKSTYPLEGSWDYVIVSRMPEPISHVTDLLVLSLDEFQFWIRENPRLTAFSDIYSAIYMRNRPNMSIEEMQKFQQQGFILASFDPEEVAKVIQRNNEC